MVLRFCFAINSVLVCLYLLAKLLDEGLQYRNKSRKKSNNQREPADDFPRTIEKRFDTLELLLFWLVLLVILLGFALLSEVPPLTKYFNQLTLNFAVDPY